METLYLEMQKAGIAFAMNKKGYLVAYNALEIEDCELCMFGSDCKDYEEVDTNTLHDLFPFWDHCEMYLIRKWLWPTLKKKKMHVNKQLTGS